MAKSKAFSPGTYTNFKSQWNTYIGFCNYYGLVSIPSTYENMSRYIVFLCNSLKSYQSLKNYVHGVRVLHRFHDLSCDCFASYEVKLVLQFARKKLGIATQVKLPISPDILSTLRRHMDLQIPEMAALWSAFLIVFFAFLRKSNLVPNSSVAFDPDMHLSRRSIFRTDFGLLINIAKSKTVQCKERLIQIPITAMLGSILDPVGAFEHLCTLVPAPPSAPAFCFPSVDAGLSTLTHASLTTGLRRVLRAAGFDPSRFAGHSFCRGGCTWAFTANVPSELLKAHGDWHSSAYLSYLHFPLSQRLLVTQSMAQALTFK